MQLIETTKLEKALILLIAFAIVYYALIQFQITTGDGHPYDAENYFNMAEQVAAGQPISELKPFTYRIALPYLVGSLFPEQLTFGFKMINLLFGFMTLVLLFLYLSHFLKHRRTVLLLLCLYLTSPISPFRFAYYLPSYVDPPALFFVLLLLYLSTQIGKINLKTCGLISLIGIIGALFREIVICGVLVLVYDQCIKLKSKAPFIEFAAIKTLLLCAIPALMTLATIGLIHSQIVSLGNYEYTNQMQGVIELLIAQPSIFFLSWLTAFGVVPLVILVSLNRPVLRFLAANQGVGIFLFGSVLLAASAGFHTDRIVFWSYPVTLLLFGVFVEKHPIMEAGTMLKLLFFVPVSIVQILAYRMWLPIPDDPLGQLGNPGLPDMILFAPYGNVILGQTYASTMIPSARVEMLGQFLLLGLYLAVILFFAARAGKHRAASGN